MFPSITVKTRKFNHPVTGAAKVRVITPQGSKTVPLDYSANDPHEAAVRSLYGAAAMYFNEEKATAAFKVWEVYA